MWSCREFMGKLLKTLSRKPQKTKTTTGAEILGEILITGSGWAPTSYSMSCWLCWMDIGGSGRVEKADMDLIFTDAPKPYYIHTRCMYAV
jgi:hypothetical protein